MYRGVKVEKSCVAPAGMSTNQTSRINGRTTHTHTSTERLGERVVNSLVFYLFHYIFVLYITHK